MLWTAAHQASLSSLSPRVCSNSCPLSQSCHLVISSSVVPFSSCPVFPSFRTFFNVSVLHIRWTKYWSFSFNISPSNEYSGLISFQIDWFDLLSCPKDSQESSPVPQLESINSLLLSLLYDPILRCVYDYWKNHSFDFMDLCQQSDVYAF